MKNKLKKKYGNPNELGKILNKRKQITEDK